MTTSLDLPRVNTPPGGWHGEMPGPFLAACTDPPAAGVPDLRGLWKAHEVLMNGERAPEGLPLWGHVERIEQAGWRVIITGGRIIHDFPAVDGTFENGCHDVMEVDLTTPIVVAASFEDGAMVLRPRDLPGVVVRRWLEGETLLWDYNGIFLMRLVRTDPAGPSGSLRA